MTVAVMSSNKSGRVVLDEDIKVKLEELGAILGHTSLSQTATYVLREYIGLEIEAAKKYKTSRRKK